MSQLFKNRDIFNQSSPSHQALYKTTDYYAPEHERCIAWNDPTLAIAWPDLGGPPKLSAKDAAGASFKEAVMQ